MRTWKWVALVLGALSVASPTVAADAWYLGVWTIAHAVKAPWASPNLPADGAERDRLLGKEITLSADTIGGPSPFACKGPRYKLTGFTADMLFQGAFGEMQAKNQAANPADLARIVGFSTTPIQTLETGCAIDFHFVDSANAEFALNNVIYAMHKGR
jgi:hypothetical protein